MSKFLLVKFFFLLRLSWIDEIGLGQADLYFLTSGIEISAKIHVDAAPVSWNRPEAKNFLRLLQS